MASSLHQKMELSVFELLLKFWLIPFHSAHHQIRKRRKKLGYPESKWCRQIVLPERREKSY